MDDIMNVQLWSKLPTEIVEQALSFLSVPVLCRFRSVCKRWNSLICEPEFGALCIRHARQDACFLVARYLIRGEDGEDGEDNGFFDENHGWSFLDVNARRWYTIKHDGQEFFDGFAFSSSVAMDGGLVCQNLSIEEDDNVEVFVSNPIAKTSKRLPNSPYYWLAGLVNVNMVVDNIAQNYKIFAMPNRDDGEPISADVNPFMIVYDSTTDQWRSAINPPMALIGDCSFVKCSVVFDGMLYILMLPSARGSAEEFRLWRYNHVKDTWNDTGVNIHLELANPQLLVSDNRLFLASWMQRLSDTQHRPNDQASRPWFYEICEVILEDRTLSTVFFRMRGSVAVQTFEMPARSLARRLSPPVKLNALGFCKSIFLMCASSGVCRVYDLSAGSWELLPKNPLVPLIPEGCSWLDYGKPMNLILPTCTLVERETEAGIQSSV